jgi:hypothetical protein
MIWLAGFGVKSNALSSHIFWLRQTDTRCSVITLQPDEESDKQDKDNWSIFVDSHCERVKKACTDISVYKYSIFFNILRTTNQFIRPSLHALKRKHISVHIRLVWWIENIQLFDSRIRNFYLRIVWINYWKYNRLLLGFTSSRCGHVCKGERA